jgi:hypothetical protein
MMEVRLGEIRTWDVTAYLAGVELAGYNGSYVYPVHVAWHVDAAHMVAGNRCALLWADAADPGTAVLVAVYGGAP